MRMTGHLADQRQRGYVDCRGECTGDADTRSGAEANYIYTKNVFRFLFFLSDHLLTGAFAFIIITSAVTYIIAFKSLHHFLLVFHFNHRVRFDACSSTPVFPFPFNNIGTKQTQNGSSPGTQREDNRSRTRRQQEREINEAMLYFSTSFSCTAAEHNWSTIKPQEAGTEKQLQHRNNTPAKHEADRRGTGIQREQTRSNTKIKQ